MEPLEGQMTESSGSESISTKRQRIADLAARMPGTPLTTLAHHIDHAWLKEAYRQTRKSGATGVDGQTAADYAADLDANLADLLERAKSGRYRAPPVRRTYIPKGDGSAVRPLGIPTFEDKVLQRAVAMVLESVYEQDFYDCSYGFRPGRSAHDALHATREALMAMGGGWVLSLDIASYFDSVDHRLLQDVVRQRVRDGVLTRLIGKWLKAGVMEDGQWHSAEAGTPQGGIVSPALANVFLHEVLDSWFEETVKPHMRGRAQLVRYADDAVLLFEHEDDARRVLRVIYDRFAKYGLTVHPAKTRLVTFTRPPLDAASPKPHSGTFDLLGFTHYWRRSRGGNWVIVRKTAKDRYARTLKAIHQWCRVNRHRPVAVQWRTICRKLEGHYRYFGVTGNARRVHAVWFATKRRWRYWLARRSQHGQMPWSRFNELLARYPLPPPRLLARHRA
jgi:group II intron reverse transcriptase/maturase